MSLQCDYIRKLFDDYISGNLSYKQKKLVSTHLKTCKACKKEYNKEFIMIDTMKNIPLFSCPKNVVKKIEDQTYNKHKEEAFWRKYLDWIFINKLRPITIGLALAIVIVMVTLIPFSPLENHQQPDSTEYSTQEIRKAKKEAEWTLTYIGHIINENNKEAVHNVLLDRFPKIIRESLKNSINIIGGK